MSINNFKLQIKYNLFQMNPQKREEAVKDTQKMLKDQNNHQNINHQLNLIQLAEQVKIKTHPQAPNILINFFNHSLVKQQQNFQGYIQQPRSQKKDEIELKITYQEIKKQIIKHEGKINYQEQDKKSTKNGEQEKFILKQEQQQLENKKFIDKNKKKIRRKRMKKCILGTLSKKYLQIVENDNILSRISLNAAFIVGNHPNGITVNSIAEKICLEYQQDRYDQISLTKRLSEVVNILIPFNILQKRGKQIFPTKQTVDCIKSSNMFRLSQEGNIFLNKISEKLAQHQQKNLNKEKHTPNV